MESIIKDEILDNSIAKLYIPDHLLRHHNRLNREWFFNVVNTAMLGKVKKIVENAYKKREESKKA